VPRPVAAPRGRGQLVGRRARPFAVNGCPARPACSRARRRSAGWRPVGDRPPRPRCHDGDPGGHHGQAGAPSATRPPSESCATGAGRKVGLITFQTRLLTTHGRLLASTKRSLPRRGGTERPGSNTPRKNTMSVRLVTPQRHQPVPHLESAQASRDRRSGSPMPHAPDRTNRGWSRIDVDRPAVGNSRAQCACRGRQGSPV